MKKTSDAPLLEDEAALPLPIAPSAWPADKVERRRIDALIPYARNARTHTPDQVRQIADSIREWGWTTPVLVDEAGVLIAGHGRVMAAQSLGLTDVPTAVANGWTDAQKRAYRIADNKLALNSQWNDELLATELAELRESGDGNLAAIGFTDAEIEALLNGPEPPADFDTKDESLPTEHACPKCGYRWSGPAAGKRRAPAVEDEAA